MDQEQQQKITSQDLANIAYKALKEAFSKFKTTANNSSRGEVIRAVRVAFIDKDDHRNKKNTKVMAECLIDMYNSALLIQGHMLETEQQNKEEENVTEKS